MQSNKLDIHALHGFLGLKADWDILDGLTNDRLTKYNLFEDYPIVSFEKWSHDFTKSIEKQKQTNSVLLGYSMGGRLALNALEQKPQLWKAAILVSAHLGLNNLEEKQDRYVSDCLWAKKFKTDSWDEVLEEWNSRDLLSNSTFRFNRLEKNYDRLKLSQALEVWSLGNQNNYRDLVCNINIPILWIAGEYDLAYKQRALNLKLCHPKSQIIVAPKSGHRMPWEQTDFFIDHYLNFLNQIRE